MISSRQLSFIAILLSSAFAAMNSTYAGVKASQKDKTPLPSVLKADEVEGDQINNLITANGNVEVRRDNSVVYADKVIYDKNSRWIEAIGSIKIKNIEIGNVVATKAKIKDDFSNGTFSNSVMVMSDGSYLTSPQIDRESPEITVLKSSIYSICPNPEISADNSLAGKQRDLFSIKSQSTTIDRSTQRYKVKHGVVRLYNFPVFYTPFLNSAFPSKERESGLLPPSYVRNKFGFGINIPLYINLAPNRDLTITTYANPSRNLFIINNKFRHMTSYGEYEIVPEIANNNIIYSQDRTTVNRSDSPYRWNIKGKGQFDYTNNVGMDFVLNKVYDRDYLRDYNNNYIGYTMSKINADYIYRRNYFAAKAIEFQELENPVTEKAAPTVLPMLDYHVESKPTKNKYKFAFSSNVAAITRNDGLQYRRGTVIPEFNAPFNLNGNLFTFNTKLQTDIYSLENNYKGTTPTNNYNSSVFNYRPEASLNWSLPLVKRNKESSFIVEPMANFVMSDFKNGAGKLPNEDSNNAELTVNNLFINDRIAGYDRNEAGTRTSFGARTTYFNEYGEYGLTLGQSLKIKEKQQDVNIRGFNDNKKSNFVGLMSYKAPKNFSISYAFQLNESDYRNEVNEVLTNFSYNRFTFSANYLLLLRNSQNTTKKDQVSFNSGFKFTKNLSTTVLMNKDLVTGRILNRGLNINYEGCCTLFTFAMTQSNPSNLTKPSTSFTFNLSFKNL